MKPHPLPPGARRLRGTALALVLPLILAGCPAPPEPKDDPPAKPAAGGSSGATPAAIGGRQARPVQPTIRDVPETGVEIGWGWHTVEDSAVPTVCVEIALGEERGQTKTMEFHEVTDSYAVMQSMDMSASASVKAMGYKASGKAAFAKSTEVSGMSSTFVLEASVDNGVRFAAPVAAGGDGGAVTTARYDEQGRRIAPDTGAIRLTPEALKLAKRSDLTAFHDMCGHSYVSAVYEGAKLTAAITIKAKSQKDKQKVSGSLSGSGWGAEVKSNFSKTATSGQETRDVSMRFFQTGGRGDTIPKDQADLLAKLDELAKLAVEAPKPFRIALTPYTALSNWPDKPIVADVTELDQLAGVWGSYVTFHERIETAMEERACLSVCGAYGGRVLQGAHRAGRGDSAAQDRRFGAGDLAGLARCRRRLHRRRCRLPVRRSRRARPLRGGPAAADPGSEQALDRCDGRLHHAGQWRRRCELGRQAGRDQRPPAGQGALRHQSGQRWLPGQRRDRRLGEARWPRRRAH